MGPPGKDVLEGRAAAIKSELLKAGIQGNACIGATRVAVELFRWMDSRRPATAPAKHSSSTPHQVAPGFLDACRDCA
jgi:hypothetical protein